MDDDLAVLEVTFEGPEELNYDPCVPIFHAMFVSERTLKDIMKIVLPRTNVVVRDRGDREPAPGAADETNTADPLHGAANDVATNLTTPTTRSPAREAPKTKQPAS